MEIVPTYHSISTVPQHHPSARRITYSSHQLRALNHANQVRKQTAEKTSKIIPYNVIATLRKLRINKKPIRWRLHRSTSHKQNGINRHNLQDTFISEDIIIKPSTQCKVGTINAQSIKNKDTFLAQEIKTNNLDLTLITETWLNDTPEDTAWSHQSDLIQLGYAISRHNRPSRGGGIALLYKDDTKVKKIEAQDLHTIECAIWQVSLKNKTIASWNKLVISGTEHLVEL